MAVVLLTSVVQAPTRDGRQMALNAISPIENHRHKPDLRTIRSCNLLARWIADVRDVLLTKKWNWRF
jgi:hypothetical protein